VVERIHLEGRSATRLAAVRAAEATVHACLATRPSPGTLHRACGSQWSAEQILLLATWGATAAEGDRLLGYLARREALMPQVSGDDLKALGLRPGPHYREILESAAVAQLDGVFADRSTALTWLEAQVVTRQQQ
jgi:tRNA nucleotidyltransferase/poly(A) polymerase